jgi:hypothetical protein
MTGAENQEPQSILAPDQAATMVFKYYWPVYQKLVSKLSNKDARRLNEAVVGYPLEVLDKNFYSDNAKEAFKIAKALMDAKFVLQQKVLAEAIQQNQANEGETSVESPTNINTENEGEK